MVQEAGVRAPTEETGIAIDSVQLASVKCHEFSVRILQDIDQEAVISIDSSLKTSTAYRLGDDGRYFDVRAVAAATGSLTGAPEGSAAAAPLLEIRVVYDLRYRLTKDDVTVTQQALAVFANTIGIFNAWPFLRESMHAACLRVNLDPMMLPLFPNRWTKSEPKR